MALMYSDPAKQGAEASGFILKGIEPRTGLEKTYSLNDFSGSKILVIIFMCNHCPYVIAIQERINSLAKKYLSDGVQFVAINSNDPESYPDDSFEKMKERSIEQDYVFPYLQDSTQEVAHLYGAICTPDFYVFQKQEEQFTLKYRGRLDDNWKDASAVSQQELAHALDLLLAGNDLPLESHPSMGCSIKWKKNPV